MSGPNQVARVAEGTGGRRDSQVPEGRKASVLPVQLYDTDADIGETKNLAGKFPEVAARLRDVYETHVREIDGNRRPTAPLIRPEGAPSPERPKAPSRK